MLVHSEAHMNLILKIKRTKNVVLFTVYCSQQSWLDTVVSNMLLRLSKKSKFSGILTPKCHTKAPFETLPKFCNMVLSFLIQLCVQLIGGSWHFLDFIIFKKFHAFQINLGYLCSWVTEMKSTESVLWCIVDFQTDLASFPSLQTI